jgi:4-hydroxybenzoyl-CoA reductase beta subunit
MKLPPFDYFRPASLEQALEALAVHEGEARILAGGTELVVRLKQRLVQPKLLISLAAIRGLSYIHEQDNEVRIGAMTPLKDVIASDLIRKYYPAIHEAARSVGSVTIQHSRGTVGGNICQDTRCLYHNQSKFWRSARNLCYKAGGQTCFAEEQGQKCRSVCQSDLAPAFMALIAMLEIRTSKENRMIPLASFFTGAGDKPFDLAPHELVTEIRLPVPQKNSSSAYQKLRYRGAIDYPLVSAACSISLYKGVVDTSRVVVGAMSAAPLLVTEAALHLRGKAPTEETFSEAARIAKAHAMTYPVENVGSTAAYRQKMVYVLTRRALAEAVKRAQQQA